MKTKHKVTFISFIVILLIIIAFTMYFLDASFIIKVTSKVFNTTNTKEFRAWDIINGLVDVNNQAIEKDYWSILGLVLLVIGGVSVILVPLGVFRFLLGFVSLVTSSFLTYLLPHNANVQTLNWGDLITIEPVHSIPIIISLILQVISTLLCGYLFIISLFDEKK
ncbi:MAG TPA: hypothetical protein VIK84_02460 [Haloplasmataceae bacterium]